MKKMFLNRERVENTNGVFLKNTPFVFSTRSLYRNEPLFLYFTPFENISVWQCGILSMIDTLIIILYIEMKPYFLIFACFYQALNL